MIDQAAQLRELARETGDSGRKTATRVIAVSSGKGGVGKTNVTTPEPTAIADAYALIKVVTRESSNVVVHLVVNQAASAAEAADVALKVGAVSRRFLQVSVDCSGYLPIDPAVAQAVRRQTPVLLADPRSPFSCMFYALSRQLDGQRPDLDRDDGVLTFLRRMMRGTPPIPRKE